MPLHDWTQLPDWDSVHQLWIVELFRWIKARVPPGYRAGLGTVPALTVGAPPVHPDVHVRQEANGSAAEAGSLGTASPSGEAVTW